MTPRVSMALELNCSLQIITRIIPQNHLSQTIHDHQSFCLKTLNVPCFMGQVPS